MARPDYIERMTERSRMYIFHVVEELELRGMPTELALLPYIESAFNPQAISSAKAAGLWQFMPGTGRDFQLTQNVLRDDRRSVLESTRAALDYLQMLHDMFGDWHLALAAYNWGQGNVSKAIARNKAAGLPAGYLDLNMPAETRNYVPKLQAVKNIIARPETFGAVLPLIENHPFFDTVEITRDIDIEMAARLAEVRLEDFKALNPSQRKPIIFAAGTPQVLLPWDNAATFKKNLSAADPTTLVIWEGQFGDFANGAQVVIDQFITSGQTKWGRLCGLVMLLPHGFEGQGPEHSSARLERYLQLCAENNIQVVVPSTPAQCFHMLRRQMKRGFRKPLVVMSPKSLLRHRLAVNTLEDLTEGHFQEIIPEIDAHDPNKITRVVACSGKVYYDVLEARRERKLENVAIIRIEQLYPFPQALYNQILNQYPKLFDVVWCQEEPKNQGAWYQSLHHLERGLQPHQRLIYAGRAPLASPAVGYYSVHVEQQQQLVDDALGQ